MTWCSINGYDLTDRVGARVVHLADRSPHRLLAPDQLADGLTAFGFSAVEVDVGVLGTVARFRATAPSSSPNSEERP